MNNNKDFLRQFFKEQNIFQTDESISSTEKINITKKIDSKQFTSNKNVNLKALFQTIEEEKIKIKQITHKQNTQTITPKIKKSIKKVSPFHSFQTSLKPKNKTKQIKLIKTSKKIQAIPALTTRFKKFTTPKKVELKIKKTEIIEDIISFNQVIQNSEKYIPLENILESKSKGKGKYRLSRIDKNTTTQKKYLLDLWEKTPERYSKHDKTIKNQEKQEAILQQNKEKRITEIQNEQNKYAQKIKNLEKNRKRQELKKNIIKEFNSYSNLFSEKTKKTTTFFAKYLQNSKNKFSIKLENYKKQRSIQNSIQHKSKIAKEKEAILQQNKEKRITEIQNEQNKYAQKIKNLEKNKKKNSEKIYTFFTEAKEWIKISGLIATVFIVGTFSLRAPGFIAQYEEYLNPAAFSEQQNSLSNLLEKTENPFQNVESLPVAGIKNINKNITTNAFLTITPPDKRIIIPKIAKNIPILDVDPVNLENGKFSDFEADVQKVLKDGVVHYPGTAEPGQDGNLFITGHSSYYPWDNGKYKDVFAALHNLEEGDEYFIFNKGKKYKYVITTRKIVSPDDVSVLDQDYTKKTSTLMTCTPVGTAKNRLILQSELVEIGY